MKQFIWIGFLCLNISISLEVSAQSKGKTIVSKDTQKYRLIDANKYGKTYLYNEEIRVSDYSFFLYMAGKEYGKDSDKYKVLIPDTALFLSEYHFCFAYMEKCPDYINQLQSMLPMIGISYSQAEAYCKWKESMHKPNKKYTFVYSIPAEKDYESAVKYATITQRKALSSLQQTKSGRHIYGLTDNVAEYLSGGDMIIDGGNNVTLQFKSILSATEPIGFRLKVEKIKNR